MAWHNKFVKNWDKIKELYDSIIEQTKHVKSSDEWISKIPEIINEWKKTLLAA